ncbi:MAG TPA: inositol monophosphatase family protein [Candidatus Limnocylindrales bacterium]|nr:inositol monophosphatase family protein [Candidatus Limnocylindrales bacterium]
MTGTLDARALQMALDFALDAAWQAGRGTLGLFQTGLAVERKADDSPVTDADKGAERLLRGLIERFYPGDGIIGEEYGTAVGRSGRTWIIDPIDGTKSFIHGVPLYGCLLALAEGNHALAGVAYFPALDEMVYAAHGLGCFWNGRRVHVSDVAEMREATLLMSEVAGYGVNQPALDALVRATRIQRTWGDSYGYALVATGRAEIMVDPAMHIWDNGPFDVILPEAGGTFTDWAGTAGLSAPSTVATNGVLFEAVMAHTRQGSTR